jgi:putative peptidoglycan lipid II flippase
MPGLARPRLDPDMRGFFRALGPAVIGSAGVQIAMFADTIIASFLPRGAVAALYYADRINQLPIGVVGIAAGTVILPEMARRIATGDVNGAHAAQSRAIGFTLALALPCAVAFVAVPDLIMRALFARGAFTAEDARAAGAVLSAYAIGLPAVVLIRSMLASFHARADTTTPLYASLAAVAVNVALKIVLTGPLGAPGLALATAAGAWVNIGLLAILAHRRRWTAPGRIFGRALLASLAAAGALALALALGRPALAAPLAGLVPRFADEALLVALTVLGILVYGAVLVGAARGLGVRLARR